MSTNPPTRPCPQCAAPWGFHEDSCRDYASIDPELTRPPGSEAFKAWRAEYKKTEVTA